MLIAYDLAVLGRVGHVPSPPGNDLLEPGALTVTAEEELPVVDRAANRLVSLRPAD